MRSWRLRNAPRPEARSRLEPIAAERWQWRHVLDAHRKEKLDRLRGYLSHEIPDGDLDKVFDQMLDDSLEKHGKRLGFVEPERPRSVKERPAPPGVRAPVARAVRRAVLKRDGYRCTSVSVEGERCPATEHLEMDHIEGALVTGSSRVEDLTTRCRLHNQYRARLRYGPAYVQRRIEEERRAREARRASNEQGTLCEPVAAYLTGQRLLPPTASLRASGEDVSASTAAWVDAHARGLRHPPSVEHAAAVAKVTAADVQAAARTALRPETLRWVVSGDPAVAAQAVQASRLGALRPNLTRQ